CHAPAAGSLPLPQHRSIRSAIGRLTYRCVVDVRLGIRRADAFRILSARRICHNPIRSLAGSSFASFFRRSAGRWPPVFGAIATLLAGYLTSVIIRTNTIHRVPLTFWEVTQRTTGRDSRPHAPLPDGVS